MGKLSVNAILTRIGVNNSSKLRLYHAFWIIADLLTVIAAYTSTLVVRTLASFEGYLINGIAAILIAAGVTSFALQVNGVYKRLWWRTSGREVYVLVLASLEATLFMTVFNLVAFENRPLPVSVVLMGQFISMILFTAMRYRERLVNGLHWRWRTVFLGEIPEDLEKTRVLVVGAGYSGYRFVRHARETQHLKGADHLVIVGFVDDDAEKQKMLVDGKPVLGFTRDIPRIVRERHVDLIVLAIHNITSTESRRIIDICQQSDAKIKVMPDLFGTINTRKTTQYLREVRIEDIVGRSSVDFNEGQVDQWVIQHKVVLVTGAAGSIGSEIARQLLNLNPKNLIVLDSNESGLFDLENNLKTVLTDLVITPVLCDVTDLHALTLVYKTYRPQVIFHAAAYKHVPLLEAHPYQAVRINIGGTLNVARLAQEYGTERFVLISSDKAVNSNNVMGATKYICEQIVRALAETQPAKTTLMCSVRFGNVVASRGSVVPLFEMQIDAGGPVTVTDKNMSRYFMSIPEAAHLVLQAACLTKGNDLFILEMGEEVRIVDLAERIIRLRGLRPYKDIQIEFVGLRPGETLHEGLLTPSEKRCATKHPYITEVQSPTFDIEGFLEETRHLLNGNLTSEAPVLKKMVLDLARITRINESISETTL